MNRCQLLRWQKKRFKEARRVAKAVAMKTGPASQAAAAALVAEDLSLILWYRSKEIWELLCCCEPEAREGDK